MGGDQRWVWIRGGQGEKSRGEGCNEQQRGKDEEV